MSTKTMTLTQRKRKTALIRRRVEFVIKYPALVRLFRKGRHARLESDLCKRLRPTVLARLKSKAAYDRWLIRVVEDPCWNGCTRWPAKTIRWSLMAKLVNIIVYEILSNRELTPEKQWKQLKRWLHVPLDPYVMAYLHKRDPDFPVRHILKGLTKDEYDAMQDKAQDVADKERVPRIWYEAAWSGGKHDHQVRV